MERELHDAPRRRRDKQLAERRGDACERNVDEILLLGSLHESGCVARGGFTHRLQPCACQRLFESCHQLIIPFSFFNPSRTFCRAASSEHSRMAAISLYGRPFAYRCTIAARCLSGNACTKSHSA